ncbi:MAG: MMPL family transporter, partial [Alphaproteobacteria bacterium]|nr:MMPL family transporter [Alphaproteobacteria bacterium]
MHEKLRHRLLGWWAGLVCDHPWPVLLATLLLAVVSVWLTVQRLAFQPDRNALVSRDLDWNQRYIDYREAFSFDDMIAVIEVPDGPGDRGRARRYADALAAELRSPGAHVRRVLWRIDTHTASPAGVRMLDWPAFGKAMHRMAAARALLEATNLAEVMGLAPAELSRQHEGMNRGEAIASIEIVNHLIDAVGRALEGEPAGDIGAELDAVAGPRYRYLTSADDRLLFMQIEPRLSTDQLDPTRSAVDAVRAAMDRVDRRVPGVEAGLTGVSVIEADETEVTQRDAALATVLAIAVIAVVMIVAFHSIHLPLLIVGALLVGVAWSFGFVTLGIGHLQLLSVTFTVMLLGLGVDFGIHLVSRFELVRDRYPAGAPGFRQAMIDAMQTMGPGIMTGALTTAM